MHTPDPHAELPVSVQHVIEQLRVTLAECLSNTAAAPDSRPGSYLIDLTTDHGPQDPEVHRQVATLTSGQLTFIHLACHPREYTSEQIAELMHISRHAVDKYTNTVYRKFKVRTRQGLLLAVIRYGVGRV